MHTHRCRCAGRPCCSIAGQLPPPTFCGHGWRGLTILEGTVCTSDPPCRCEMSSNCERVRQWQTCKSSVSTVEKPRLTHPKATKSLGTWTGSRTPTADEGPWICGDVGQRPRGSILAARTWLIDIAPPATLPKGIFAGKGEITEGMDVQKCGCLFR
jgi:hypothetical protein